MECVDTPDRPPADALLRDLLLMAVQLYGRQERVAHAIGICPARLSRVLHGADGFSFSVRTCLRLARALGRSPSSVLRAAGKIEEAELIESMYGEASVLVLTPEEQTLILALRADSLELAALHKSNLRNRRDQLLALMFSTIDGFKEQIGRLERLIHGREREEDGRTIDREIECQEQPATAANACAPDRARGNSRGPAVSV